MFRVYDDRNYDKTLFQDEDNVTCVLWIRAEVDEDSEDFNYIWLEEVEQMKE